MITGKLSIDTRTMRIFVFAIFFSIGAVLAGFSLHALFKARASLQWPQATAQIIESGISKSRLGRSTYSPHIRYRYEVGTHEYESNMILFMGIRWAGDYDYANDLSKRYAPGTLVNIRYNPSSHEEAVLIPGPQRETQLSLFLALVFMAFGMICYFAFRKRTPIPADQ